MNELAASSIVTIVKGTLHRVGFELQPSHSVLDFGCGSGRDVYAFRDAGYRAFGVDLKDFLHLRSSADRQWFELSSSPHIYQLPYPDNSFDVIYSNQVLEHVVHYEPALQEMRRVLKPDGVCLHVFPSKWRPIEAHFRAPFGGAIRWEPWLMLWAFLGLKNRGLPEGLSAREHARINWMASRTNYTYHSYKELRFLFSLYFSRVRFAEAAFVRATANVSAFSRLVGSMSSAVPAVYWFYRHFHTKVVVLEGTASVQRSCDDVVLF